MTRLFQFSALGIFFLLSGCVTTNSGTVAITKVNPYHYQPGPFIKTEDGMIDFEQRRYEFGAVESSEKREKYGNYYTIFWKTESKAPVTVRFDYRQGSTGAAVQSKEVMVPEPGRSNTTKFEIVGEEYQTGGKVTQWKASIIENGTVVAEYKSYLWQ
jgi:hypothetical protein